VTTDDYKKLADGLPRGPGVYQFHDADDTIIYIGKAKNLKSRLSSYFGSKKHQAYKTRTMVKNAARFQYTIVDTEADALLLENTLIKKFQPRYNVMLKDGKSYTYVCVKKERFPRVFFTRKVIRDGSDYFGPYTSKARMKVILELIKTLFPLRSCSLHLSEKNILAGKFKVCLEYHIENCLGPCVGEESEEEYDAKIAQVKNILRGHFGPVKDHIKTRMRAHAEQLQFEKAEKWKVRLEAFEDYQSKSTVVNARISDVDVFSIAGDDKVAFINYLKVVNGAIINSFTQELIKNLDEEDEDLLIYGILHLREKFNSIAPELVLPMSLEVPGELTITVPQRGDKRKLLELSQKNVNFFLKKKHAESRNQMNRQTSAERILKTLQADLNMSEVPLHIECFDNSNIQGTNPTASCVVFKNAKPSKKDYRHFKIKTVEGPDDFASMTEIVKRRYSRLLREKEPLPQLIVIDGGKGQLSASMKSIYELGIQDKVTVIGIAKKLEEIYFPGDPIPLHINKKSEGLKLIQQARNEAHRFAITLHRNLRSKDFTRSVLDDIPGIGSSTVKKLLKEYGSTARVRDAGFIELKRLIGMDKAKRIATFFEQSTD